MRKEAQAQKFTDGLRIFTVFNRDKYAVTEPDPENVEWEKKHKFARLQSFATRTTRASLLRSSLQENETETSSLWNDLSYEISEAENLELGRQLSHHLCQQEKLVKKASHIRSTFDGKVCLLRHEKFTLDTEIKRAELQLFILKCEHKILSEYEEREGVLAKEEQKLIERKDFVGRKIRHIEPNIRSLQEKMKTLRDSEDRIRVEFDLQLKQVINQKRFRKFLNNIFQHNIKGYSANRNTLDNSEPSQVCVYQADMPIGTQLQCSISSMEFPSVAKMTRSSLRWTRKLRGSSRLRKPKSHSSLTEFDVTDVYTCPRDLDKKVFQAVHILNKQLLKIRHEIEEEMSHNQDMTTASSEAKEELSFIDFELANVSGALHQLRLEKFNKWKEIPFAVNIQMDQIQFSNDRILRKDLWNSLIFDEKDLDRLEKFIEQVQTEISFDVVQLESLKEEYEKFVREQIIYTTKIDQLKMECRTIMTQKIGGLIDLDMADSVRVDPQIQEIKDLLDTSQQEQDKLLCQFKKHAAQLKINLTRTRAETTEYLKTITNQMAERDVLVKRANDRTDKIGRGVLENVTTEDLYEHQEKLMMWQTMAETQAAEIEALETEIALFKRKEMNVSTLMGVLEPRYRPDDGDGCTTSDSKSKERLHDKQAKDDVNNNAPL